MKGKNLDRKQKIQEQEYGLPYHWFWGPETRRGRVYWGYLNEVIQITENLAPKSKFLDAGCGDAHLSYEIKKRGHDVWGFDYSERAVAFAKLLAPDCIFNVFDIKGTSYKDSFFDVVSLIEVLEHLRPDDIPQALEEMRRVLRPGGVLIVTVPSVLKPLTKKHYQHFFPNSLDCLLKESGFEIKYMYGQDRSSFLLRFWDKLTDNNRGWQIKFLTNFFNLRIYTKLFNICPASSGKRIIAVAVKP